MNYGTLLSTQESDMQFLIRVEEMQIRLVQITTENMKKYELRQLMKLSSDTRERDETLKGYLSRIPSIIELSLLFC